MPQPGWGGPSAGGCRAATSMDEVSGTHNVLAEYVEHYNTGRPHRALQLRAPGDDPNVIPSPHNASSATKSSTDSSTSTATPLEEDQQSWRTPRSAHAQNFWNPTRGTVQTNTISASL